MCIGLPMRVIDSQPGSALCEGMGARRQIDTVLLGETPDNGTWLLVFLDSAREVITAEQAAKIGDALTAVNLAMKGETQLDHLFADLVDREPELPAFLRSQSDKN